MLRYSLNPNQNFMDRRHCPHSKREIIWTDSEKWIAYLSKFCSATKVDYYTMSGTNLGKKQKLKNSVHSGPLLFVLYAI